jgi:hypothetical protein
MTLESALLTYANEHIDGVNAWYDWSINRNRLPIGISLSPGTTFQENVALKLALHQRWLTYKNERSALEKYYVADWGGVRGNAPTTLEKYASLMPQDLLQFGAVGIATWSKILCVRNPYDYAIFDARVSIALNFLQVVYSVKAPVLFSLLPGQNRRIEQGGKQIRRRAGQQSWQKAPPDFYVFYLNLLKYVANARGDAIWTIEMLLFAKAEELIDGVNLENE